jgi:hypothetical protein
VGGVGGGAWHLKVYALLCFALLCFALELQHSCKSFDTTDSPSLKCQPAKPHIKKIKLLFASA